ncbi:uncharacterized protein LOC120345651 [Styela clava]
MEEFVDVSAASQSGNEIPDSGSTTVAAMSPNLLGNLADMFTKRNTPQSTSAMERDEGVTDSQETHLSSGTNDGESEVIPILPNCSNCDEFDGVVMDTQSTTMDEAGDEKTEQDEINERNQEINEKDRIHEDSQQQKPSKGGPPVTKLDWKSRYDGAIEKLENIEKKIKKLSGKTEKGSITEAKLVKKDSKLQRKIVEIVIANKSEKEDLVTIKNSGKEIDNERLHSLTKCHRKLVAVVHLKKSLSKSITEFMKRQKMNHTQEIESSQSLMDSSMLPKDSRGLAQQKCLPPSILKISTSDLASQKKTVKFHIPFKEAVQSKPEQQETVDEEIKKPPILETNSIEAIPHAGFDVDMTDIFEESQGVDTEATQNIDEAFSGDSLRTSNIVTSSFLQRKSGKNPVLINPSLSTNKISVIQTRVPKQVHTDDNMVTFLL